MSAADQAAVPLATISALDVSRYMGTWYELAKFPNRFQKKCVGDTSAEYNMTPDGQVDVINRCRLENGEFNIAVGSARQVGGPTSPKLKVRFAPAWLSFIPAVWGNYWIIDLDDAYQLVAISEPSREYLWILSRTPQVDREKYQAILNRIANQGLDTGRLEITTQNSRP